MLFDLEVVWTSFEANAFIYIALLCTKKCAQFFSPKYLLRNYIREKVHTRHKTPLVLIVERCVKTRKCYYFIQSFAHSIFSGEGRGAVAPRGLEIPHGFHQPLIVLLAPHQDGTKQGRRYSHSTWFFVDLWAAFTWV